MERTIRLDLNAQRARSDLSSFGAEVDRLIDALSRIDVDIQIDDGALRAVRQTIDGLDTVIAVDLAVDTSELDSAADDVADLSGSVIDVDIALDDSELATANDLLADLDTTVTADVQVNTSELDIALDRLADIGQSTSSRITVDSSDLDRAVREARDFPDPIETEIEVDSSGLDAAAGLLAGGGFAAGVTSGFSQALDLGQTTDLVTAQLGLTVDAAEVAGDVAANVYAGAWGDSVGEVGEALQSVGQNLVDVNTTGGAELENLTIKSLDLASALDEDVGGVTRTVGQLVRTGLAEDFDQAFDIIAAGLQNGSNRGEDLLDTFNEYSTSFAGLGLSAEDALGILNNGLDAGVDNTDRIADGLREFRIRVQDGTVAGIEGFDRLGVSANDLEGAIAAGGPAARTAFQEVVQGLQQIQDPVERDRLAFQLFGTQLEDFGVNAGEVFAITEDAIGGVSGAAEQLGSDLNDNAATKIEEFKRTALLGLTNFVGNTLIPVFELILPVISRVFTAVQGIVGPFIETFIASFTTLRAGFETGDFFGGGGIFDFMNRVGIALREVTDLATLFFNALTTGFTEDEGTPIESIALFIRNDLIPAVVDLGRIFLEDVLPAVVSFIRDTLLPIVSEIGGVIISDVLPVVIDLVTIFASDVLPILLDVGQFIATVLVPILATLASIILSTVVPVVVEIVGFIAQFLGVLNDLNILIPLIVAAVLLIAGPFTLVGAAIVGVITFLITLYQRFEFIQTVVGIVVSVLGFLLGILGDLLGILFDVGGAILSFIINPFGLVGPLLSGVGSAFGVLADVVTAVFGVIVDVVGAGIGFIIDLFSGDGVTSAWSGIWDAVTGVVTAVWGVISGVVSGGLDLIVGIITTLGSAVLTFWSGVWDVFSAVVEGAVDLVATVARTGLELLTGIITGVLAIAGEVWEFFWASLSAVVALYLAIVTTVVETGLAVLGAILDGVLAALGFAWDIFWASLTAVVEVALALVTAVVSNVIEGLLITIDFGLAAIGLIWDVFWTGLQAVVDLVALVIERNIRVWTAVLSTIFETAVGALTAIWSVLWTTITTVADTGIGLVTSVIQTAGDVIGAVFRTISSVVTTVWTTLWTGFQLIVQTALSRAQQIIQLGLNLVTSIVQTVVNVITRVWQTGWNLVSSIVSTVVNTVSGIVRTGFNTISSIISQVMNVVRSVVSAAWSFVSGIFQSTISTVTSTVQSGFRTISSAISTALNTIQQVVSRVLSTVSGIFTRIWSTITRTVSTAIGTVSRTISTTMSFISRTISVGLSAVSRIWSTIWNGISRITRSVASGIQSFMGTIINAINRVLGPVRDLIGGLGRLKDLVPSVSDIGGAIGGIDIPFFGDGGVVSRPTLAMIGERYGKEAIVPEYASLREIKGILGRTNVLDRLAADFSAQQRAAFFAFNDQADTDINLTGPPPDDRPPGPMYVDQSSHQYDLRIVDGTGTAASKQRTASTVVAEIKRRRRPPARAGAGSWRSAS